jgi:hypothetical protein
MTLEHLKTRLASHAPTLLVGACCVVLDGLIIGLCLQARTSAPIVSPWDLLPGWIFAIFALATALLALGTRFIPRHVQTTLFVFHAIAAWGVAAIVYRLGFGFDPFIHQAAEQHLVTHGSISLQTPLYIGQYSLVWLLQKVSHLSVIQIDRWLVPILSLGLIPLLQRTHRLLPLALFLLPVSAFSFTIPFHLALLLFICAICLSQSSVRTHSFFFLGACAVATILIHPLIGIPCLVFVLGVFLGKTRWEKFAPFIPALGIPLGLLGAMASYAALQHASLHLPTLGSIQASLTALFGTPYQLSTTAIGLSFVYIFLSFWPLIFGLLGLQENLREQTPWKKYRLATALGLFTAAIILACFIRLPDIIAHEQFEFPLRLLHVAPFLLLPDVALFLERLLPGKTKQKYIIAVGSALAIGVIAASQWFGSYPQQNEISPRYAPSVSEYEYAALAWIEEQRDGKPFVVLSHQMLAAAALQQKGFDQTITTCYGTHLSYAIPTGGALYQDFLAVTRSTQLEETLKRVKACYGDASLFIVLPRYWDQHGVRDAALTPLSHSVTSFGTELRGYQIR